ncbi:MAG TPA: HD domain-containing protein [Trebonia sp.]|nr:HD domain-containing protein [Trebonia sp.]
MRFAEMFRAAAGREPDQWLSAVAADGLPGFAELPPGAAKTEVILAWLWRRLHCDNSKNASRRLIYALPQGSVVEPAALDVREWLARLDLLDSVGLHVTMGSYALSAGPDWREDMHQAAIVIGTTEYLVSKALNRALGLGAGLWPIDFALVTSGAHWVIHESRLSPQAAATMRQVHGATRRYPPAEPFGLTELTQPEEPLAVYPRLRGVERALLPRPGRMAPATPPGPVTILEHSQLADLFDTSPGAVAAGPDITPYVADAPDLDVWVAWATWTPGPAGEPDPEVRLPAGEFRCPVPRGAVGELAHDRTVWHWGPEAAWERVTSATDVRPAQLLLVSALDGGYDPASGFDPSSRVPVPGCPELLTPAQQAELAAAGPPESPPAPRPWQTLSEHSEQVRDQAAALLAVLTPAVPAAAAASAVVGGYLHDVGKAHPTWQDALCALAPGRDKEMVKAGRPWAKSGGGAEGRLEFAGGASFRHELASLLLIDSPLRALLAAAPDEDLCRYLVLAHHGRLRMRVAEPSGQPPADGGTAAGPADDGRAIFGLRHGATADIPPVLGRPASTLTVSLGPFGAGDTTSSWYQTATELLQRYGPFRLAYLETIVRVADWRASGGRELPLA